MENEMNKKWPKRIKPLSPEKQAIMDESMLVFHEKELPGKYSFVEHFNDSYPVKAFEKDAHRKDFWKTLEIGGGTGNHIASESMDNQEYHVLELRDNMFETLKKKYPDVVVVQGDCQCEYADENTYDRIIAIHVLEHLPNLPEALRQMHRVLKRDGVAHVVIPCEGSLAYTLGRKVTTERWFKMNYHMDYTEFIKSEHINTPKEIIEEIERYFTIKRYKFFPLPIHAIFCNLIIGMTLYPKEL